MNGEDVTFFQSLILALVQGGTEFLPISSSAHLILVSEVWGPIRALSSMWLLSGYPFCGACVFS